MVLQFSAEHPVREVAGARALMLDHSGNIHSIYRKDEPLTGGLYWDYLCVLPALVPPSAPLGLLGLGAGTAARIITAAYPGLQQKMVGWELDPGVVMVSQLFLGLGELEADGKLLVCLGDALSESVGQEGPYAGLLVDLFAEGRLLPQLLRVDTWRRLRGFLVPGGRLVANIGTTSNPADATGEMALAAMAAAWDGELLVRDLVSDATTNTVAMTGPMPDDMQAALPAMLKPFGTGWRPYTSGVAEELPPTAAASASSGFSFQDVDDDDE